MRSLSRIFLRSEVLICRGDDGLLAKLSSPWHADTMDPNVGPATMMRSMTELGTNEISWRVGERRLPGGIRECAQAC